MEFSAITFMPGEAILREKFVVFQHEPVAGDFRNYRGGRDREALRVAPHDTADRASRDEPESPVHDNVIRKRREVGYSFMHRLDRGLIDIYLVYHLLVDYADADNALF